MKGKGVASKNPRKTVAALGQGTRLSDQAYIGILAVLFDRKLPAGAFVSQAQLVELTGVPVGPLRDALRVLEAEGVLTIHPHTGIQFVKPGLELTRSTFQFRGIIEAAAVAIYAEIGSESEIREIKARHRKAEADLKQDGVTPEILREIEELEEVLHGAIVSCLNNPLIDTSYRRIRNYLKLMRLERKMTVPLLMRSLREHILIIDACANRDADAAASALQAHFAAALQRSLGLY
jgi:DNA-binding GntR family transcriptional regulator